MIYSLLPACWRPVETETYTVGPTNSCWSGCGSQKGWIDTVRQCKTLNIYQSSFFFYEKWNSYHIALTLKNKGNLLKIYTSCLTFILVTFVNEKWEIYTVSPLYWRILGTMIMLHYMKSNSYYINFIHSWRNTINDTNIAFKYFKFFCWRQFTNLK